MSDQFIKVDTVILNTKHIMSVKPNETHEGKKCVKVSMTDGSFWTFSGPQSHRDSIYKKIEDSLIKIPF